METIGIILLIALVALLLWGMYIADGEGYERGYKDGQIDLINGDLWYELTENESGEKTFEELEEPKKVTTNVQ